MDPLDERSSQPGVAPRTSPKFSDDDHRNLNGHRDHVREARSLRPERVYRTRASGKIDESIPMRKTIAKALTWRVIGTAEIFAISFWTTGHIATAGHTAGIAAVISVLTYVAHELVWTGSFSRGQRWGQAVEILPEAAGHDLSGPASVGETAKDQFRPNGFARTLRVSAQSVRSWIGGRHPVPTTIAMLVNLMINTRSSPEDLRA